MEVVPALVLSKRNGPRPIFDHKRLPVLCVDFMFNTKVSLTFLLSTLKTENHFSQFKMWHKGCKSHKKATVHVPLTECLSDSPQSI